MLVDDDEKKTSYSILASYLLSVWGGLIFFYFHFYQVLSSAFASILASYLLSVWGGLIFFLFSFLSGFIFGLRLLTPNFVKNHIF